MLIFKYVASCFLRTWWKKGRSVVVHSVLSLIIFLPYYSPKFSPSVLFVHDLFPDSLHPNPINHAASYNGPCLIIPKVLHWPSCPFAVSYKPVITHCMCWKVDLLDISLWPWWETNQKHFHVFLPCLNSQHSVLVSSSPAVAWALLSTLNVSSPLPWLLELIECIIILPNSCHCFRQCSHKEEHR